MDRWTNGQTDRLWIDRQAGGTDATKCISQGNERSSADRVMAKTETNGIPNHFSRLSLSQDTETHRG